MTGESAAIAADRQRPAAPSMRRSRPNVLLHGTLIAVCVGLGALLAVLRGQDSNFDQMNYHAYSAYAYLADRLTRDVAPAQVMHSYFSPFVYLPFYAMMETLPPRAVAAILGGVQGLNLWLVFLIARLVAPPPAGAARGISILSALGISAAAPMAYSELGTSMADLLVSLPALAGLALLMRADAAPPAARRWAALALAGALLGAATSLKLTSAAFAVGLAAAAPVGWNRWSHRIGALIAVGLGGAAGFAAIGGSWYITMWRMFGNPVFPYFNTVFHAPDYPSQTPLFDLHFIPHGFLDALSYPFRWFRLQQTTTELQFRDIRFAVLIVLGVIALGLALRARGAAGARLPAAGRRLLVFFVVAFGLWLYEWSIQRYIVVLELLAGPLAIVLLRACGLFAPGRRWAGAAAGLVLAAACLVTVRPIDWSHLAWADRWYAVTVPAATPDAVYFIDDDSNPLAYVVASLPPGSAAVGIVGWENVPAWGDTVFTRRIHALLGGPDRRQFWSVSTGAPGDGFRKQLAQYGLKAEDSSCQTTAGRPFPLTWCKLTPTSASAG